MSEKAYYQLLFLEGTAANLGVVTQPLTLFRAAVDVACGADLTLPPFDAHEPLISSPTTYEYSQPLGAALRSTGVEALRFVSARDLGRGTNLGLLAPVFASNRPTDEQPWRSTATKARVEFMRSSAVQARDRESFTREEFLVHGQLPAPGIA